MTNSDSALAPQWTVFGNGRDPQQPFDVAVIMPTIGRPEALKAVRSVYDQKGVGQIQLLIGVDKPGGDLGELTTLLENCPPHVTPCLFYPGYSTSVRHGGLHPAKDGGVLRCTLTHLANAVYVTYLDDDNWWGERHLEDLLKAIQGHDWAYSYRWFVHPDSKQPVCIDEWESVGPGQGVFLQKFGGFVDPNCLMFNKLNCWGTVVLWNIPLNGDAKAMSADRNVFHSLKDRSKPGVTGNATAFYVLDPNDGMQPFRLEKMGDRYDKAAMAG